MNKTILLAGGTGLIGSKLSALLKVHGYQVRILTRNPKNEFEFAWDPKRGTIDDAALQQVDYVVNLAGAGIADKRWTKARKRVIIESRVQSAQVLSNAMLRLGIKPKAYIAASAIGYYGNSGEQIMSESNEPVDDSFLVTCCQAWEQGAQGMADLGIRTVVLRIGVVLSKKGGALSEISKPIKWNIGTYFEDGQAWWSWIHRDDICSMILWAIESASIQGVYNAVAPNPVRGLELVRKTAAAMNKTVMTVPAPSFALRLVLGEMSAVVLNSNYVSSKKIEQTGFKFKYRELEPALADIFPKSAKS